MSMMGWENEQNTQILFRAEIIPGKHQFEWFLAITIPVCQIQMILTLIPLQNQHFGMGICANQTNLILSGNLSWKTPFWVVFGYKNSSVSNPNDFNTQTIQNQHVGMGICANHTNIILS